MLNSEALAEPASASTGRIAPFGKYLLLQRVSVGGMAEIFKALPQDATRIDEIVAIKRILPNIAEDSEFIGMFIDEARIAGQLNHPNICRIHELGRVNDDHYIAMQFLWGRDLLKVMNRHKKAGRFVSASMAAFVGSKACAALHYAHTKCDEHGEPLHIIHRDVSPQNIIVGYSGQVKLIDFGVARAASQSQRTQAGILKGKFGYMSPEMIRGLPIDHRSDVFAMGICLHELLTNARLFYGETDFATLELVRDAKVVPPSRKAPGVPPELDAIVMKALSREADHRYQDAAEMQEALEQFLARFDPQYGETDAGVAMRQAFHVEVERERERLEIFWGMLDRGELVRGASIPSGAPESADSGQRSAPPPPMHAAAPVAPEPEPPFTSEEELQDEQTHIFFSSNELDELRELEQEPAPARRVPATLSDMIPPAPKDIEPPPVQRMPAPSGTFQRTGSAPPVSAYDAGARRSTIPPSPFAAQPQPRISTLPPPLSGPPGAPPRRRVGTVPPGAQPAYAAAPYAQQTASPFDPSPSYAPPPHQEAGSIFDPPAPSIFDPPDNRPSRPSDERLVGASEPAPERGSGKFMRHAVFALLAVALAVATYAVPRFADRGTGSVEIEAVGDGDALVRVDGVVRGNPPLVVEGLAPGVHQVEIEAAGYALARADVNVESGSSRAVKLELERASPLANVGSTEPAAPALDRTPEITPLAPAPGAAASERPKPARVKPVAPLEQSDGAESEEQPKAKPERPAAAAAPTPAPASEEQGEEQSDEEETGPTVEASGSSETQTGESVNIELAASDEGELLISTVPWSHVFVDDEDTGRDTPIRSLRVTAGAHRIGLRTPDDVMHQVEVVVEAGKVVRIIRRF